MIGSEREREERKRKINSRWLTQSLGVRRIPF
jgi:hypothetical protein